MAHHRLILDDFYKEEYTIVAIHSSVEAYKMAFYLNKYLQLRLKRRRTDLEFSNDGLEVQFPLFEFENNATYTVYNLVANKCRTLMANTTASGSLFETTSEDYSTSYLIPEYKKVDYFLKITSEYQSVGVKTILSAINTIKPVISAYSIESKDIKSKNNLIFN